MSLRGVLTTKQSPASFWACSDPAPAKTGGNEEEGEESRSAQGKLREESCHAQGRLREEEEASEGSLDSSVASGNLRMIPIGL
jgi:hypothetical protein